MSAPVLSGRLPEDGIASRLVEIEARGTTGVLRWKAESEGEVALVRGQIADDQAERPDGEDPLDLLLAARQGTFEVIQQLPPLPVSRGDAQHKSGSLEVHVPADLMNYCEQAGLTGALLLERDEQRAELVYDAGELSDIRLGGLEELHEVFSWEEGVFEIAAYVDAPDVTADLDLDIEVVEEAPPTKAAKDGGKVAGREPTGQLLRVVEVTLAEILKEREERRPATRTSPPRPPMPAPKKHDTLPPPSAKPEKRKDQTVRVIYLGDTGAHPAVTRSEAAGKAVKPPKGSASKKTSSTKPTLEEAASKRAAKARSRAMSETAAETKPAAAEEKKELPTMVWVLFTLLIVLSALVLIGQLPPME
ncbi:MAG TPA: DUF4388 domain-containing protein [Polyangiaceae bacterium LLY-WYZ-15_(1-7)]|nr:hypothetical protein [Sandaracinus sp.]HJL05002.1 DUF4388 domain-containing protein [Polyangiaceae bacterium LLY-WYZ-15_(1-7)]MBJ75335.1 hypothetical protein [Sandaracinus sp.]HJL09352.1 DUF4388 domain-containing protein [Polyangiaceae bacterium LLY-WYZ-15_(1-7)]HJL24250.1 DUF4388 domain-containing protein [Polyangiaceae bacterium LLY-WYZ-15_(1-7)]